MRNPNRLDNFYDELRNIHKSEFPDWRFGQFMMNFLSWVYGEHGKDPFYIEEDTCVEYLNEYADAITNPFHEEDANGN